MSHLYLPAEHTDTDLALASAVAEAIDSNELFVAWTWTAAVSPHPRCAPASCSPGTPQRSPLAEAFSRSAAAFKAVFGFFIRRPRQSADTHPPVRASRSELENA